MTLGADRTDLSHVRATLREAELTFQLLVESVQDYAIFMLDPQGRVTTWNVGAQRIKGYRAAEIVGKHFSRFYPEADVRDGKCERELEEAARVGRFEDEGWRLRKDGSRFWANVVITALRDADGALVGFAKVTRDLTERRRAEVDRLRLAEEAALRKASDHFMQLLGGMLSVAGALAAARTPDDVARILVERGTEALQADSGVVVQPSDGQLEILATQGLSGDLVSGWQRFAADDATPLGVAYRSRTAEWIEDAETFGDRYPRLRSPRYSGAVATLPLVAGDRVIAVVGFRFVRPRRFEPEVRALVQAIVAQATQALERARTFASEQAARREADVANRTKDEFLATVSHELRTPLNAILGWARMLGRPELDEPRRGRAVATIERNAIAMAQLIEDLLDMSRIVSGKMRLQMQQVDVPAVVGAAIESIDPASAAKGIDLTLTRAPDVPALCGDPARLQQVVWNLLSNAVKFTPRGGRVDVTVRESGGWIEVGVTDTGKGIAPAFLPHVFESFRQEDASVTRTRGGLGLGLAISRQIVELHGGRLEARSEGEGKGATFTLFLPVSTAARPREATEEAVSTPGPPSRLEAPARLQGLRVLAVDDEEDARQLVAAILEQCGCRVRVAKSVDEAMAALAEEVPDILLSDIGMPGQDGYALIRRIRALPRAQGGDVPAAALTAYARAEDRQRLLEAGYSIHLAKPVEPAELVSVVTTLTRFLHRGDDAP